MSVQLDRKLRKRESSRTRQGFRKPRAEASVNWGLRDPMMRAGFGWRLMRFGRDFGGGIERVLVSIEYYYRFYSVQGVSQVEAVKCGLQSSRRRRRRRERWDVCSIYLNQMIR